ncbi:hypothetical protein BHM03_00047815, partial [Ensete ventricosum]
RYTDCPLPSGTVNWGWRRNEATGKAPYRAVRTGPPADWYADHPLPSGTIEIDRWQSISVIGGRLREKEEEGETCSPHAALPRFPRAIHHLRAKNRSRDLSPTGDSSPHVGRRKVSSCGEKNYR